MTPERALLMGAAVEQARLALAGGQFPVGAILASGEEILGVGHNRIHAAQDFLRHAEIEAIHDAAPRLYQIGYASPVALFTTLEPCLMCMSASVNSLVQEIYYAIPDPEGGAGDMGEWIVEHYLPDRRAPRVSQVDLPAAWSLMDEFFLARGEPNKFRGGPERGEPG